MSDSHTLGVDKRRGWRDRASTAAPKRKGRGGEIDGSAGEARKQKSTEYQLSSSPPCPSRLSLSLALAGSQRAIRPRGGLWEEARGTGERLFECLLAGWQVNKHTGGGKVGHAGQTGLSSLSFSLSLSLLSSFFNSFPLRLSSFRCKKNCDVAT